MSVSSDNKELYENTNNPAWVWKAIYDYCIDHMDYNACTDIEKTIRERPVLPDWIVGYLWKTACNILHINKPNKDGAYMLQEALGFRSAKQLSALQRTIPLYEFEVWFAVVQAHERLKKIGAPLDSKFYEAAMELEKKFNPEGLDKYEDAGAVEDDSPEKKMLFKEATVRNVYYQYQKEFSKIFNSSLLTDQEEQLRNLIQKAIETLIINNKQP